VRTRLATVVEYPLSADPPSSTARDTGRLEPTPNIAAALRSPTHDAWYRDVPTGGQPAFVLNSTPDDVLVVTGAAERAGATRAGATAATAQKKNMRTIQNRVATNNGNSCTSTY